MTLTTSAREPTEYAASLREGALYILPSDDKERQRLTVQHRVFTSVFSERLIVAPVQLSGNDEVLEIGAGTAAWTSDVCSTVSQTVQLYGIDIEPRLYPSPASLGPNVHLSVHSGLDLPSEWTSKFKLIHQRLLILAYSKEQWQRAIEEMFRVTAPGGYVQLIEIGPDWISGRKTASHVLFIDDFLATKGMIFRITSYLADMLRVAGFTEVKVEEARMKVGAWAGEEGIGGRDSTIGAMKGMRDVVMKAGGHGRFKSIEEFNKAIDEISEEWDKTEGSYATLRAFYGRKPL